jgi:general secretion pathway protein C
MNAASWLESLPANDRWRTLLIAEGPRLATWVLAVALAAQAAFLVTDLATSGGKATVPVRKTPARSHQLDVTAITQAHIFGVNETPAGDEKNLQPEQGLVLTGIIAGNDPKAGLAILGASAESAQVYAVGDSVAGGVKLHSVYSDHVVVDRNGELKSLTLPHEAGTANAPPPSTAALQADNPALERMRRMISEQPGLIGDVMRPQPVMDHGRMNGFRVYPGRDRMAFMRLGLRPGDQVTAINGTPLDDRDRSEQILRTLTSSSEARVTVIRGGQQQDLVLNIAQVAQEAESLASQSQGAAGQASAAAAMAAGANGAPPNPGGSPVAGAAAPPPPDQPPPMPEQPGGENPGQ